MRITTITLLGILMSGCVILPKDRALAKEILDTHGSIENAAGAQRALTAVFEGSGAMTEEAQAELNNALKETRYANALFYFKAMPLVAAGDTQAENTTKALQEVRKHASSADNHLTKAEAALKESVK